MFLIWNGYPSCKASDLGLSIVPLTLTKTMCLNEINLFLYLFIKTD